MKAKTIFNIFKNIGEIVDIKGRNGKYVVTVKIKNITKGKN